MTDDSDEKSAAPVDDLSAPLGQDQPKPKASKLSPALIVPWAIASVLGFVVAIFAGWGVLVDNPYGGEPIVIVSAEQRQAPALKKPDEPAPTALPLDPKVETRTETPPAPAEGGARLITAADPPAPGPGKTVTIIDGSSGQRRDVPIGSGEANARPPRGGPDPKLFERTRHGEIPRIAEDGTKPLDIYAQTAGRARLKSDTPRIAIVVGGLGIGSNGTAEAFAKLPAAVTFAFAPYGADLERHASRARGEGHEILLQVPMEPFDYPDNDPGPHSLLTSLSSDQNVDRLQWLMSRFKGFVGISNYMGARFTATDAAFAPVLRETAKRGLLYLDDGSSPRSLASQIAGASSLPFAKASLVIDAVPTPAEIDRALTRLESLAVERGSAIGVASALPVSIERIAAWTKTAESRGYALVPITAVAVKPKTVSTN